MRTIPVRARNKMSLVARLSESAEPTRMQSKKARRRALCGTLSTLLLEDEVGCVRSQPQRRGIFLRALSLLALIGMAGSVSAQSAGQESCEPRNRSAALGVPSSERTSILSNPSCSLRLVLQSPVRGEQMSIPSGLVERNFMGTTFTAPFNKISDLLVLTVALQNDSLFPATSARGSKESVAALKNLEDDPTAGLRWSFIHRAPAHPSTDDRVSLRATWRNKGASSGFSMTEVRLAPSHFTVWCR